MFHTPKTPESRLKPYRRYKPLSNDYNKFQKFRLDILYKRIQQNQCGQKPRCSFLYLLELDHIDECVSVPILGCFMCPRPKNRDWNYMATLSSDQNHFPKFQSDIVYKRIHQIWWGQNHRSPFLYIWEVLDPVDGCESVSIILCRIAKCELQNNVKNMYSVDGCEFVSIILCRIAKCELRDNVKKMYDFRNISSEPILFSTINLQLVWMEIPVFRYNLNGMYQTL